MIGSSMTMANVPPFETIEDMQRLQDDLLQRLTTTSIEPGRYEGLADCGAMDGLPISC
jgi:hypothetical protein